MFSSYFDRTDRFLSEKIRIIVVGFLPLCSLVIVGIIFFAFEIDFLTILQSKSRYHDRMNLFVELATSIGAESEARTLGTLSGASAGMLLTASQIQVISDAETTATNAFYAFINGNSQFDSAEVTEITTYFYAYRQAGLAITSIMVSGVDFSSTQTSTSNPLQTTQASSSTTSATTTTQSTTTATATELKYAVPTTTASLLAVATSNGRGGRLISGELDLMTTALAIAIKRVTDNALTRFRASINFYMTQALSLSHMDLSVRMMSLIQPSATGGTTTSLNADNQTQTKANRVTVTRNINGLGIATKKYELLQKIANRFLPTASFTTESDDYIDSDTPTETVPTLPRDDAYGWAKTFLNGITIINFTTTQSIAQSGQYQRVQNGRSAAYQPTLNELDRLSMFLSDRMNHPFSTEGRDSAVKNIIFVIVALIVTLLTITMQFYLFRDYLNRTDGAKRILMAFGNTKANQKMVSMYRPIITGLNVDVTLPKPQNSIESIYYQCAKFMATEIRPFVPQALFGRLVQSTAIAGAASASTNNHVDDDKHAKASSLLVSESDLRKNTTTSNFNKRAHDLTRRPIDTIGVNVPGVNKMLIPATDIKNGNDNTSYYSCGKDRLPMIASQSIRLEIGMTSCKCTILMISIRTPSTSWARTPGDMYSAPAGTASGMMSDNNLYNTNPFMPPSSIPTPPQPGTVHRVPSSSMGGISSSTAVPFDASDASATIKGAAAMAELTVALNIITSAVNQEGGMVYSVAPGGNSVTCVWGIVDYRDSQGGNDGSSSPTGNQKGGGSKGNYSSYDNYTSANGNNANAAAYNQANSNTNSQAALSAAKVIAKRFELLGLPRCMSVCTGSVIASHSKVGSQKCVLIIGGHMELATTMLRLLQTSKLPSMPYNAAAATAKGMKPEDVLSQRYFMSIPNFNTNPAGKPLAEILIDEDTFFETPRTQQRSCKPIAILANIAGLGLGLGDNGNRYDFDNDVMSTTNKTSSISTNQNSAQDIPDGAITASFRPSSNQPSKRFPSLDKAYQGDGPQPMNSSGLAARSLGMGESKALTNSGHNTNSGNVTAGSSGAKLGNSGNNTNTTSGHTAAVTAAPAATPEIDTAAAAAAAGTAIDSMQSNSTNNVGKNIRTVVYTFDFSSTDLSQMYSTSVSGNPLRPSGLSGSYLAQDQSNKNPTGYGPDNLLNSKTPQQQQLHTPAHQWKLYSEAFNLYRSGMVAQAIVEFKKYLQIFPRDFHAQWLAEYVLKVSLQRRMQFFGTANAQQNKNSSPAVANNANNKPIIYGIGSHPPIIKSASSNNYNNADGNGTFRGTTPVSAFPGPNSSGAFPPTPRGTTPQHANEDGDEMYSPKQHSDTKANFYGRDDRQEGGGQNQYHSPQNQMPHPPMSYQQIVAGDEGVEQM